MSCMKCSLCTCDRLEPGDVTSRLVDDFSSEDGPPDYIGLKRALEEEYSVDVTVSGWRRHVDEHVIYRWSGGIGGGSGP